MTASIFDKDNQDLNTLAPSFIPVIDFTPLNQSPPDPAVSTLLVEAFSNSGFVYLKNHGISQDMYDDMFRLSKLFFARDLDYKMKLEWDSAESNRGYSPQDKDGRASEIKILRTVNPDLKESFEVGKEDANSQYQNKFGDDWPEFRHKCQDFFDEMHLLNVKVMSAISVGLGLDKDFFNQFIDKSDNTLRLLRYPKVPFDAMADEKTRRSGAHCDYGSITLLCQDQCGGLEVFNSKTGEFVKATPIPGTIIVNVGDMLQRWSNDYLKSTLHRVVKPYVTEDGHYPARYSIAYFCNANYDSMIECIEAWLIF